MAIQIAISEKPAIAFTKEEKKKIGGSIEHQIEKGLRWWSKAAKLI